MRDRCSAVIGRCLCNSRCNDEQQCGRAPDGSIDQTPCERRCWMQKSPMTQLNMVYLFSNFGAKGDLEKDLEMQDEN